MFEEVVVDAEQEQALAELLEMVELWGTDDAPEYDGSDEDYWVEEPRYLSLI